MEQAGAGESVIALSLNTLTDQMPARYSEWKGLIFDDCQDKKMT